MSSHLLQILTGSSFSAAGPTFSLYVDIGRGGIPYVLSVMHHVPPLPHPPEFFRQVRLHILNGGSKCVDSNCVGNL